MTVRDECQSAVGFARFCLAGASVAGAFLSLTDSPPKLENGMQEDTHHKPLTVSERADELEERMMHELERIVSKSTLFHLADGHLKSDSSAELMAKNPGKHFLMGADPRLPKMP